MASNRPQYDLAIVGGGISGLVCALTQARRGRRVVLVATQPGPLLPQHSGSLEILGRLEGNDVTDVIAGLDRLPEHHPYRRIGLDRVPQLLKQIKRLVADVGLPYRGHDSRNHYRISPLGIPVPCWLTLEHYVTLNSLDELRDKHVALMRVPGYLDQAAALVAYNLEQLGAQVTIHDFTLRALQATTPTPRATTLSRKLDGRAALDSISRDINAAGSDADLTLMPAIIGDDEAALRELMRRVTVNLKMMATLPPTVAGNSLNNAWQHYSLMLGVTVVQGETVVAADIAGDRVTALRTARSTIEATDYVFATGALAGGGLRATPGGTIVEAIAALDREGDITLTDERRHPYINGRVITNLQVIGHLLGGFDAERHEGEGIDLLTALSI